jgi:4-hydroxybenzoate polyprenyltransferase
MRRLRAVLTSLRPQQWAKNLLVFAGLIFAQKLFTPLVWPALAAFVLFCVLSGAVYLFNDVADRDKDRRHPTKRLRPVASGALGAGPAVAIAGVMLGVSLALGFVLSSGFGFTALAYALLLVAYSVWLQHVLIVDVLAVAGGFVLRAASGALVIDVEISGWLLICTILLGLLLALGKRRYELVALDSGAARHRPVLAAYSTGLLDQMIVVVTASTVTAYALYTMSPETVVKFHTRLLPGTLPFVLYGVFRYLYLLHRPQPRGDLSELLLRDRALLLNTLLWMVAVLLIIYGDVVYARVRLG